MLRVRQLLVVNENLREAENGGQWRAQLMRHRRQKLILGTVRLLRFCQKNGQIPNMGARVENANHLGSTLSLGTARPPTPLQAYRDAVDRITAWRAEVFRSRVLMEPISDPADPMQLNDLQQQVIAARNKIRAQGLPEGQP